MTINLINIINLSLKLDTFCSKCKIEKIKPLFNKGISLLPLILKVTENTIHNQTQDYRQRNKLLCSYQSSFRANHSVDTCFSQLTDLILNGARDGLYSGLILIDLQKAIDNFDHKVFSDKMKCIDFLDKTIKWFHSYLTYRAFFVSLDNVILEAETINGGISPKIYKGH